MGSRHFLTITVASLSVASCSTSEAIERMAGENGKREAFHLADLLCSTDREALRARFDPKLWVESEKELAKAPAYCPNGRHEQRLAGYFWESRADTSGSISQKQYVVVSRSPGKWTTTTFVLEARNGAAERIVSWSINAGPEKPADLEKMDAFDASLPKIRAVALGALVLAIVLVGGVIRYFRRQHRRQTNRP